jgi:sirohydrochlorin cobaltochelatase
MLAMKTDAIVLFAHGSRDPLWRAPMEAIAEKIRQQSPHTAVRCSYLELCEPSLPDAVAALLNATNSIANYIINTTASDDFAYKIKIIPMFLGMGKHAREDLPELVAQLRHQYPNVNFEIAQAVGEDERLQNTLAQLALS